jgi:hypothetical protein
MNPESTRTSSALSTAVAISLVFAASLLADSPQNELNARDQDQKLRADMRAAHTKNDFTAYLAHAREFHALLNDSPNSVLQLMSAQAFAGDQDSALHSLEQFIGMGQSNKQVLQAAQFDSLRKSKRYPALLAEMAKNETVVAAASKVFPLSAPDFIPEDIDYDAATRQFYITSILKNEILFLDTAGKSSTFARAPDPWPMLALKIDSRRRILWATEVALKGFASIPKADWGTSAILLYNLDSGKLLHRVAAPPKAILGDMTLTRDGDALLSDNDQGAIYRVDRKTFNIVCVNAGDFISPQTPAMSPDGRRVFVPDYVRGIGILDLQSRHVSWLASAGVHALAGIDGLYLYGTTLLATQNGTSPERVIRFELDPSLTRVQSESIIERATPSLGDPTHGVLVDNTFYYIANSGWDSIEDDGSPKAGATPSAALLMRLTLKKK